jgi:hypothetical protein
MKIRGDVLIQPEMERGRSPLVSNLGPPGGDFQASGSTDPMWFIEERRAEASALRSSSDEPLRDSGVIDSDWNEHRIRLRLRGYADRHIRR